MKKKVGRRDLNENGAKMWRTLTLHTRATLGMSNLLKNSYSTDTSVKK